MSSHLLNNEHPVRSPNFQMNQPWDFWAGHGGSVTMLSPVSGGGLCELTEVGRVTPFRTAEIT